MYHSVVSDVIYCYDYVRASSVFMYMCVLYILDNKKKTLNILCLDEICIVYFCRDLSIHKLRDKLIYKRVLLFDVFYVRQSAIYSFPQSMLSIILLKSLIIVNKTLKLKMWKTSSLNESKKYFIWIFLIGKTALDWEKQNARKRKIFTLKQRI